MIKMEREDFIKELTVQLGYDEQKCKEINKIIEENYKVGQKNKENMIAGFINLGYSEDEAEDIYEVAMGILLWG